MGRHFALTLQLPNYRRNSTRRPKFAISGQVLGIAVFTACCLLAAVYLIQANSFSTKGFEIRTVQDKVSQLRDEQRQLQVQSAELQSFQRIQGDPKLLNMVPVTSVSYLRTTAVSIR